MLISQVEGADAPTVSAADSPTVEDATVQKECSPEIVRHMVIGSLFAVRATIKHLHKLRYADISDWSQPIPTERPKEVMVILTKKVKVS